MAMLSPGVEVREVDLSLAPSVAGSSFAIFCGDFEKGPAESIVLITSVQQFIDVFGKPNNQNYNHWYQVYNFLQYSNTIYVSRATDSEGFNTRTDTFFEVAEDIAEGDEVVSLSVPDEEGDANIFIGDFVSFGEISKVYKVISVDEVEGTITVDNPIMDVSITGTKIYQVQPHMNAVCEVGEDGFLVADADVYMNRSVIKNGNDFVLKQSSIVKDGALKFIAKNPGVWGVGIDICIASEADFKSGLSEAFEGINLNGLFQYTPNSENKEYAVVIKFMDEIVESFLVSLNEGSKDFNGKSNFIEEVINRKSSYVYCIYGGLGGELNTHLYNAVHMIEGLNVDVTELAPLAMKFGTDGTVSKANLMDCYDLYEDKEIIDIDIVIIPEELHAEGIDFCTKRADVIGYFGARFEDVVGVKSTVAVNNLVTYITKDLNKDSKYVSFVGNYDMIYDRYNDKSRWINTAGSSAGLRAFVSNSREPWTSSAGLNNGVYRGVLKIAQSFNLGQRDLLFKNAINVTTSFPGSGITLFGDKTLIQKESAFNAVGVRCLFNYAERATAKMAKYVLFEQNTATTRNLFVSSLKPFYERMVAKGGLEDFRLIADESNNTPLMRQNKTFVCDIYLKPTGVIWFAKLTFTNVGLSVSFSEVVGTV